MAYYHPECSSDADRETLEMRCARTGTCFKQRSDGVRCYYLLIDSTVGASDGEETRYVYAELAVGGEVHGRPISAGLLRKKGARL